MSLLLLLKYACLAFHLVASLKPLHPPGGIHYPTLPGEERMALTAQFNLQYLPGGTSGKGIATSTDYLGIGIILGMNLILHLIQLA